MEPDNFKTYEHEYTDGRKVQTKLYPNELLADFRKHFYEEWITKKSEDYFSKRDIKALPFLEKVKMLLKNVRPVENIENINIDNLTKEDINQLNNTQEEIEQK